MRELTAQDVAEIIYQAIEDQPRINPGTLVPVITSLIRAFAKANNVVVVEKKEQARKHAANISNLKSIYWQRKVKELQADPEKIQGYYADILEVENTYKRENGLPTG